MDNGTFVDNMLDFMKTRQSSDDSVMICLDLLKQHYTKGKELYSTFPKTIRDKIDLRVKDMLDVIDPMWYVVALYHRNKGGLWRDMHKYGVKPDIYYSYNIENPPPPKSDVYTQIDENDALPTL
ncbi:hypothetical protein LCGC14_2280830 [marine sediment metagenome]|uniref:Uncharacterized protein n=1 Tax=marine sediment metagenome TaxID=412755 RepID=A0A0F9F6N6_9ZZZZ